MGFLRISTTFLMFVILCFAESALADVQDALANLIDENLKTCVAEQIDINLQASEITKIECDERDIADLSGLSAFVGLTSLSLNSNKISDLNPLAGLINIEFLGLSQNLIHDISPISELTNLKTLYLRSNLIVDINPLSELIDITLLTLGNNLIVDISPLAELINCTRLFLEDNSIEDVSPLSNLITLTDLNVDRNAIQDISSLGNLVQLKGVYISNNRIEDLSVLLSFTDLSFVGLDIRSDSHFNVLNSLTELVNLYVVAREYRLPSYEIFNIDGLLSLECDCVIENLVDFLSVLPLSLEYLYFVLAEDVTDLSPVLNLPDAERFWGFMVAAPGVRDIDFLLGSGFQQFSLLDSGVECIDVYRLIELSRANGGISLSATGCYRDRTFDVDGSLSSQPLTDGLLVIRYLFGFSGSALTSGAVAASGWRVTDERISEFLGAITRELDIDGDGESKPLTDGLLLIRYLFGFSGDSLISGAIGSGAERDTAEEVEAYIQERVPAN